MLSKTKTALRMKKKWNKPRLTILDLNKTKGANEGAYTDGDLFES